MSVSMHSDTPGRLPSETGLVNHEGSFGPAESEAARWIIRLGLAEDLGVSLPADSAGWSGPWLSRPEAVNGDVTSAALIAPELEAVVSVVARQTGVLSGCPLGRMVLAELDPALQWETVRHDGDRLAPGDVVARLKGSVKTLLTAERTVLNLMTHLSGIASFTRRYVDAVAGTSAVVLDTRKTHPGYRRLEKYAVRCGGGTNHRLGLYDGVLIKDNHLAAWQGQRQASLADAVTAAREATAGTLPIEVEVDTLEQLVDVLHARPEVILLDNFSVEQIVQAVQVRNATHPATQLEVSGGVTLSTIRAYAECGVERISVGALTHSAPALDLGLDWAGALPRSDG